MKLRAGSFKIYRQEKLINLKVDSSRKKRRSTSIKLEIRKE